MKLTQASRYTSEDKFPAYQLFLLAICRLAEPVALTSIFPYAWLMVRGFHVGSEDDASFYAGILISAFSLCEAISGMFWGSLSDRIGRKPVLLMGCCGTVLSLLIVGFSQSFTVALFGRALGGLLNGNIGVIQTMVAELVKNPKHEPKAYAIMPFVWAVGTIVGPAVGGLFANPVKSFPTVFPNEGFFVRYPWALPNIICATIMIFSILLSYFCLEETHPDLCGGSQTQEECETTETTPVLATAESGINPSFDLRRDSYGTFNNIEVPAHEQWSVRPSDSSRSSVSEQQVNKWFTWRIAMLLIALGIYTYHAMCYEHLFPIFLQDNRGQEINILAESPLFHIEGGLGLETKTVGLIMSVNGIIALFIQAVVFPLVTDKIGIYRTFILVTLLHPIAFFIVPYLVLLPSNLLFTGIYACLMVRQFLSILDYPVLLIMLKQACPAPRYLGKINGLAASVGAACRMIAPPIAGLLYSKGRKIEFTGLAWFAAGLIAMVGMFQLFWVPRDRDEGASIRSLAPCLSQKNSQGIPEGYVDIVIIDEEDAIEV